MGEPDELPTIPENESEAASLASLAQSISDEPIPAAEQVKPQPSQIEEIAGIILGLGQLAAMRFKSLEKIYTVERCTEVAQALSPAFEKLGWRVTGGDAGAYITALAAVVFLGYETREAIKHDLNQEQGASVIQPDQPKAD